MRRALAFLFVAAAFTLAAASVARADTVTLTTNPLLMPSNFTQVSWAPLGANVSVANGTSVTEGGLTTTVSFSDGSGNTYLQCPAAGCSWAGTFAPGDIVLDNAGGSTVLSFSSAISAFGFQANPDGAGNFLIQIIAYDGATSLASFTTSLFGGPAGSDNNTAGFYGIDDLSGANITSIQLMAYDCSSATSCSPGSESLAISPLVGKSSTPEPASLVLLASGFGMLGFLRRKLAGSE